MASVLTIVLFFAYTWGMGYSVLRLVKEPENFYEKLIMRIGVGLGVLPIFAVLLNFLRVPLDWKIFLVVSLALPLFFLIKGLMKKEIQFIKPSLKLKKSTLKVILLLIIFAFSFYMYSHGSFNYSYLEDTDSWGFASITKYISIEKTAFDPPREDVLLKSADPFSHLDPYPPGYGILMGVLHQTNDSVSWTLKFFNSLIISLGLLFFYFFAKNFIEDSSKALFATFVLAAIPSYLTHFIWAHSLVITLFFPAIYCLEKIQENKKWGIPSALVIASIFLIQPTQPIKIIVMFFIYFIIKSVIEKRVLWTVLVSQVSGVLLSFIWWGHMLVRYGGPKGIGILLGYIGKGSSSAAEVAGEAAKFNLFTIVKRIFNPAGGTATRAYSFNDFFVAQPNNMINSPVGWGIVISLLVAIALIFLIINYKKLLDASNAWKAITLGWFIFAFLAVNSATFNLPIGLVPFRFWLLLAIPASLLSVEGAWSLKRLLLSKYKVLVFFILILGIIFTSAHQKYSVNTSAWPTYSYFMGQPNVAEKYGKWFSTLPKNTPVFFYSAPNSRLANGFDMYFCSWCNDIRSEMYNRCMLDVETEELHSFLKRHRFEYLLIGSGDIRYLNDQCGENRTQAEFPLKIQELAESGIFQPVHQEEGIFLAFKVI